MRSHIELREQPPKHRQPPDHNSHVVHESRTENTETRTNNTGTSNFTSQTLPNNNKPRDNLNRTEGGQPTTNDQESVPQVAAAVGGKSSGSTSPPHVPEKNHSQPMPTEDTLKGSSSLAPLLNSTDRDDVVDGQDQLNKTDTSPLSPTRPRTKFSGYIQTTSQRTATSFLSKLMTKLGMNACPEMPPDLHGPLEVDLTKDTVQAVEQRLRPLLLPGGWYRPVECNAKDRVAIIIPFRDREEHLPILLKNLHPMLMRQQVNYGIFVVEETKADPFNRASLMNVGFLEANKMENWDCFIFHDVDLIPLNDRNLYRCPEQPRHMSVAIDVFEYK